MADEALTAGAVARRLGVAVTTLRTWHQRYGLGPSRHIPGQHRRYTPEDLSRLEVMRRLTGRGMSPAEAAAWARRAPLDGEPLPPPDPGPPLTDLTARPRSTAPSRYPPHDDSDDDLDLTTRRFRDGGGNAIPIGRGDPAARGLARAAMRLDASSLREVMHEAVVTRGVVNAWEQVIMPVLIGIGERYEATRRLIDVEHLTSRCVTEVLGSITRSGPVGAPKVLLACADEDQHTLSLEALAAALAENGVPSRLLGARVPPEALADAVSRTGPLAVVVWSQLPQTAHPSQLTRMLTGPGRPMLVAAAGPGWTHYTLPAEIQVLGSLTEAVKAVLALVSAADG